jgi:hypothetical protein
MVTEEQATTEGSAEEVVEEIQTTEPAAEETESSTEEVSEPEYEPSFGYKVYDEDREFDEWAQNILKAEGFKSKEIEEHLRDLHARSGAFDRKKEENKELKGKLTGLEKDHSEITSEIDEILYYLDNDLDTFFEKLKVPNKKVFDYVERKLEEEKMDPNQRAQLQNHRQSLVEGYQNQRRVESLESENQKLSSERFELEMSNALSAPGTLDFSKKFDDLYGAGAFKTAAMNYGRTYYLDNGRDTTPLDAVLKTIDQHRNVVERLPTATNTNDLAEARKAQEAGKPGGHIPNVGGGSVSQSPINKRAKTMEDLKKQVAERLNELQG